MSETHTQNEYEKLLGQIASKELDFIELDSQMFIEYSKELKKINNCYGISPSIKQSFAHLLKFRSDLEQDFREWNKLQIEIKQLERLLYMLKRRLNHEINS